MKSTVFGASLMGLVAAFVWGCNQPSSDGGAAPEAKAAKESAAPESVGKTEKKPATAATTAAEPAKPAQPSAGAEGAVVSPAQQTYPIDAIKTVADDCATPEVLLTSAPKSVGPDYAWHTVRQAMLANQQFRVVSGAPTAPGEVQIAPYAYNDSAYALVARCKDGATCNRLAAMYKAIVRSSKPQVVCGAKIQGISGGPASSFRWDADPKANLPVDGETIAMCARLDACMIATDQSTPGDPFLKECQKGPSKFKDGLREAVSVRGVMACWGSRPGPTHAPTCPPRRPRALVL